MNAITILARALVALGLTAAVVAAQEAAAEARPLALGGLDPVALCAGVEEPGVETLTDEDARFRYRFASAASLARFAADPARYGVQWGGACGRMGPLSGRGDPARFAVHAGRIYVFASEGCRDGFLSAPGRFVTATQAPFLGDEAAARAGREIVERAARAHGGAALDRVLALGLERRRETQGWVGVEELRVERDGSVRWTSAWTPPEGQGEPRRSTWSVGRTSAYRDGKGEAELGPDEIEDVQRLAHRLPTTLLQARHRPGFRAVLLEGDDRVGEIAVRRVGVFVDGLATVLLVGEDDDRVLGLTWEGRLADGVARAIREEFGGWFEDAGVLVPLERRIARDGRPDAAPESFDRVTLSLEAPAEAPAPSTSPDGDPR